VRREAYAEYLTAVYRFMDRVRELIAKLAKNADMGECDSARRAYLEDWGRHLQPAYAPVLAAGPSQIEESAETCASVLVIWQINTTDSIRPEKPVINFATPKKFLAQLAARDARSKFASAVRDHV
jgi:hypothetical protein